MQKFDLKNSALYKVVENLLKDDYLFITYEERRYIYCKNIKQFVLDPSDERIPSTDKLFPQEHDEDLNFHLPSYNFFNNKSFPFNGLRSFLQKYELEAEYILNGDRYIATTGNYIWNVYSNNTSWATSSNSQPFRWPCFEIDFKKSSIENFNDESVEDWLWLCFKYGFDLSSIGKGLRKKFLKLPSSSEFSVDDLVDASEQLEVLRDAYENSIYAGNSSAELMEELSETMLVFDLLNCDRERADLEPYDKKMLFDPNQGHWELDESAGKFKKLVKRDPHKDVKDDGIVGIDFGTKSTVVVFQSGSNRILPMRVGTGELKSQVASDHFENPTIVELVDIKSFMEEYENGWRPQTSWEDFKVSHQANRDYYGCGSSGDYGAFFSDLKQWAGKTTNSGKFCLRDKRGVDVDLNPYNSLGEKDFDPVEIYAYYLGLYINNMYHGIFLKYYLSFPVTYELDVQNRIVKSFKKGLKKSFPAAIAEDSDLMSRFDVNGSVSEPAAYAVCALKEYGFNPEEGKKVYYGIFDFGGGTTDFDFGEWSISEKRKYDYKITHFGAQGDKFLGGENLLKYVAFDIFKKNKALLLEKDISFTAPTEDDVFVGSEKLISSSNVAVYNTKSLMEAVRPIWEGRESDEFAQSLNETSKIMVTLLHNDGSVEPGVELEANRESIMNILRTRIDSGVGQFFRAFETAFANRGDKGMNMEKMYIFLAGNSSKSPLVKEAFAKHVNEIEASLKRKNLFVLHPPIGSDEFYEAKKSIDPNYKKELDTRDPLECPTGKTGVAFGLLMSRKGGKIEVENLDVLASEIPFKFYLGYESRGKFQLLKDDSQTMKVKGKVDLGVWYEFYDVESGDDGVEVFYTDAPDAVTNQKSIENVKRKTCEFKTAQEDGFFFIKAVDPHTFEYAVARDRKNLEKAKVYKMSLGG